MQRRQRTILESVPWKYAKIWKQFFFLKPENSPPILLQQKVTLQYIPFLSAANSGGENCGRKQATIMLYTSERLLLKMTPRRLKLDKMILTCWITSLLTEKNEAETNREDQLRSALNSGVLILVGGVCKLGNSRGLEEMGGSVEKRKEARKSCC